MKSASKMEMVPVKESKKPTETKPMAGKRLAKKVPALPILLTAVAMMIVAIPTLISGGIKVGAESMWNSYNSTYSAEKDAVYQTLYNMAFERAEKNYHVSNTAIISIGNLETKASLEVLQAGDVEFITEDKDDDTGDVTAWLEVSGEGIFTVDLQMAEFIVDNQRKYILVRLPKPELTNIRIANTEKKLFKKDDWGNGSFREGFDLAMKQQKEARMRIQKSLLSNQFVFENAEKAAERTVENLVKRCNPDIPNLTVEVEFMNI